MVIAPQQISKRIVLALDHKQQKANKTLRVAVLYHLLHSFLTGLLIDTFPDNIRLWICLFILAGVPVVLLTLQLIPHTTQQVPGPIGINTKMNSFFFVAMMFAFKVYRMHLEFAVRIDGRWLYPSSNFLTYLITMDFILYSIGYVVGCLPIK